MAGHSQFKNIMHRKGAQDAKRAKAFAKLIREVTVAAKLGGPDPYANPRLRSAVAACRQANMPKDNIDRAVKKASGGDDGENYEEVRYEGYGPRRRRGDCRGVDRQPQPNGLRRAGRVLQARRDAGRNRRGEFSCSTGSA